MSSPGMEWGGAPQGAGPRHRQHPILTKTAKTDRRCHRIVAAAGRGDHSAVT